jgi:hypothetical protein
VLGYVASIGVASSVAAPLLAGVSFTLISLLIPYADQAHRSYVRWLPLTLAFLMLAAGALLGTVQCGVSVRRYDVSPDQLLEYEPQASSDPAVLSRLQAEQAHYIRLAEVWSDRARWTYHLGITALLTAMTLVLVPTGRVTPGNLAPTITAGALLAAELVWIANVIGGEHTRAGALRRLLRAWARPALRRLTAPLRHRQR